MREVVHIQELERAKVALNPIRIRLLTLLREPRTCAELAKQLELSQQRVNNHLKELLKVGLIRIARRRRVRNLIEATYEAVGKAYWISPKLLRGGPAADAEVRDRLSLHNLLLSAESIQADVAALLEGAADGEVPSLGISVEVALRTAQERHNFTKDVMDAIAPVIERYQGKASDAHTFNLNLMCYPKPSERT